MIPRMSANRYRAYLGGEYNVLRLDGDGCYKSLCTNAYLLNYILYFFFVCAPGGQRSALNITP